MRPCRCPTRRPLEYMIRLRQYSCSIQTHIRASDSTMMRVQADMNAITSDGKVYVLMVNGRRVEDDPNFQLFRPGQKVILYQDEGDFEVDAEVGFGMIERFSTPVWYAIPDDATLRDWDTRR